MCGILTTHESMRIDLVTLSLISHGFIISARVRDQQGRAGNGARRERQPPTSVSRLYGTPWLAFHQSHISGSFLGRVRFGSST